MSKSYKYAMDKITLSESAKDQILNNLQNYTPKSKINHHSMFKACALAACLGLCVFSTQRLADLQRDRIQNHIAPVQDSSKIEKSAPTDETEVQNITPQANSEQTAKSNYIAEVPVQNAPNEAAKTQTNQNADASTREQTKEEKAVQNAVQDTTQNSTKKFMQSAMQDIAVCEATPLDDYNLVQSVTIRGTMIEETYQNGNDTLVFRYAPVDDDISGDFDDYETVKTIDGITLKGNDAKFRTAIWHADGYSFSAVSSSDFAEEDLVEIAKHLQSASQK